MNYRRSSHILVVFLLLVTVSCNSEKKKYAELLQSKDLVLAYEFKTKFPESVFNIDSLIQSIVYTKVLNSQSVPEYIKFKEKYPQSIHKDTIQSRLYKLEWGNLKKTWSTIEVQKYIDNYPNSPYSEQAEEWLYSNATTGTFTDKRDGHKYKWQKVGYQIWMAERLTFQKEHGARDAFYIESELSNACPEGWSIPTTADWIQAMEYITKITFGANGGGILTGSQFFTDACIKNKNIYGKTIGEWNFWTRTSSNSNDFHSFKISDAYDKYQNAYYVLFGGILNNDNLYILCIKNSKDENNYDPNKYFKDTDGTVYRTIKMGNKLWMNDNLSTTKFSNGDSIPTTIKQDYCEENQPIYQWDNGAEYGRFYTGYVITDKRNVCPTGWHVATNDEWREALNVHDEKIKNNDKENILIERLNYKQCNGVGGANLAYYWTSTGVIMIGDKGHEIVYDKSRKNGMAVRCVMD